MIGSTGMQHSVPAAPHPKKTARGNPSGQQTTVANEAANNLEERKGPPRGATLSASRHSSAKKPQATSRSNSKSHSKEHMVQPKAAPTHGKSEKIANTRFLKKLTKLSD